VAETTGKVWIIIFFFLPPKDNGEIRASTATIAS
jgi:hypothetical protein